MGPGILVGIVVISNLHRDKKTLIINLRCKESKGSMSSYKLKRQKVVLTWESDSLSEAGMPCLGKEDLGCCHSGIWPADPYGKKMEQKANNFGSTL